MHEPSEYINAIAPFDLPDAWQVAVEVRQQRTRVEYEVGLDGRVTIFVLPETDPGVLVGALWLNRSAITQSVAEMHRGSTEPIKQFVDGEPYDLLGRTYHLKLTDGGPPAIEGDRLLVARGTSNEMCRAIVELHREAGLAWMRKAGEPYEASGLIEPGLTYAVKKYDGRRRGQKQQKVGDYSPKPHCVSLHWALFGFPLEHVECGFVHELTHATRPPGKRHGREWKDQFTRWMPDWQEREARETDALRKVWFGAYPKPLTGRLT